MVWGVAPQRILKYLAFRKGRFILFRNRNMYIDRSYCVPRFQLQLFRGTFRSLCDTEHDGTVPTIRYILKKLPGIMTRHSIPDCDDSWEPSIVGGALWRTKWGINFISNVRHIWHVFPCNSGVILFDFSYIKVEPPYGLSPNIFLFILLNGRYPTTSIKIKGN